MHSTKTPLTVLCSIALTIVATLLLYTLADPVDPGQVFREFMAFLAGDVPRRSGAGLRLETVMAALAITVPVAITANFAIVAFIGWPESIMDTAAGRKMLDRHCGDNNVSRAVLLMGCTLGFSAVLSILEELVFRGIFGGWMGGSIASRATPFLLLAHLGNVLFALIHAYNFRGPVGHRLIRTAPQYWFGLWCVFILAKFGLLAAIILHVAYNTVVLLTVTADLIKAARAR